MLNFLTFDPCVSLEFDKYYQRCVSLWMYVKYLTLWQIHNRIISCLSLHLVMHIERRGYWIRSILILHDLYTFAIRKTRKGNLKAEVLWNENILNQNSAWTAFLTPMLYCLKNCELSKRYTKLIDCTGESITCIPLCKEQIIAYTIPWLNL